MDFVGNLLLELDNLIHKLVAGWAEWCLRGMFDDVQGQIGLVNSSVSTPPTLFSTWGSSVYNIIKTVSENAVIPVAALIITALFCYELVEAVLEKNAMHDMDSAFLFKWLGKACICIFLLSKTFDISMAVFDLGSEIASTASTSFASATPFDTSEFQSCDAARTNGCYDSSSCSTLAEHFLYGFRDVNGDGQITADVDNPETWETTTGELLAFCIMALIVKLVFLVVYIYLQVILLARMFEIMMYISVAPIPFATFMNKEWGTIGTNYVKALAALALQAFFIVICVGIFSVILNTVPATTDLFTSMVELMVASIALIAGISGSKNFALSVMNAH